LQKHLDAQRIEREQRETSRAEEELRTAIEQVGFRDEEVCNTAYLGLAPDLEKSVDGTWKLRGECGELVSVAESLSGGYVVERDCIKVTHPYPLGVVVRRNEPQGGQGCVGCEKLDRMLAGQAA